MIEPIQIKRQLPLSGMSSRSRPHSDYRVLLVYPNIQQCALMPYSIGLFTALLKREGFQVALFDSTFYLNDINANYTHYQTYVKAFNWAEKGVEFKQQDMLDDFVRKVEEFGPDLIALSVVENTYPVGRAMIRALPDQCPTIAGVTMDSAATAIELQNKKTQAPRSIQPSMRSRCVNIAFIRDD